MLMAGIRRTPREDDEPKPAIVAENDHAVAAHAGTLPDRRAIRHPCDLAALALKLDVAEDGIALLILLYLSLLSRSHQIDPCLL